jgi:tetraacyldisaccharide 4'-kinase
LSPFSLIYNAILSARRLYYTRLKEPGRLPARVISIGNLSLGGTGKTPAVITVSREAQKRGFLPCILTRGYKGSAKGPGFVTRGNGPVLDVEEAGDEPYLMAVKLSGVPVILGKDRYRSGLFGLKNLTQVNTFSASKTIFILDDGFQHIALHRDTDVLLIDTTRPFWLERLFPDGRLREPASEMKRADIIILTKSDASGDEAVSEHLRLIKSFNPAAPVYRSSHRPISLIRLSGETEPLETISRRRVYGFSGIANPSYFRAILASCGAEIEDFRQFRDHYRYTQSDIDTINREASGQKIVTTEKDLVKLKGLASTDHISALMIDFSVEDEFFSRLFETDG